MRDRAMSMLLSSAFPENGKAPNIGSQSKCIEQQNKPCFQVHDFAESKAITGCLYKF